MNTTATTKGNWFRPLFIDDLTISKIVFYDDSGVKLQINQGWLELDKLDTIELSFPNMRKARKLDYSQKDCFIIKDTDETYKSDPRYELHAYIDNDTIKLSDSVTALKFETNLTRTYDKEFTLTIPHAVSAPHLIDGKVEYYDEQCLLTPKKISVYSHTEFTELGLKVNDIEKTLANLGVDISRYDIAKIIDVYDMSKLEPK